MPTASWATFANGARQFVVHDAFEMTSCLLLSYWSSLTPRTMVRSGSVAGAEITTFFAPASRCLAASSRLVKKPVDSSTTSTPRSLHGSFAGSRSSNTFISLPSTMRPSPRTSTSPGYGPRIESYLNRWASVALSVMSLTATHSMSVSFARPARSTLRPMRPNPLIPTRTGMCVSVPSAVTIQERPQATARAARPARRRGWRALPRAADQLDPGAVRIDEESGVSDGRPGGAGGGRTAVAPAGREPRLVRRVDGAPAGGGDRHVPAPDGARGRGLPPRRAVAGAVRGLAGHDPQLRAVAAVADAVGRVDDAPAAERAHEGVVEARGAVEVGDLEGDVVEHGRSSSRWAGRLREPARSRRRTGRRRCSRSPGRRRDARPRRGRPPARRSARPGARRSPPSGSGRRCSRSRSSGAPCPPPRTAAAGSRAAG